METQTQIPTLTRVDERTFEVTKVLEGWPIRSYVKVSPKGERVTIYSWTTTKCDLNVHKRLVKDKSKAIECYLYQVTKSLQQVGMTEEQVKTIVEEVRRRLEK
jgi:hypothetical protein